MNSEKVVGNYAILRAFENLNFQMFLREILSLQRNNPSVLIKRPDVRAILRDFFRISSLEIFIPSHGINFSSHGILKTSDKIGERSENIKKMSEKIGERLENNEEYSQNTEENSTISQKGIG